MRRAASAFLLVIALAGCAKYSLIQPSRTPVADLYTVEPQIPWSSSSSGKTVSWTVDGPPLQELRFISGLEDGEAPLRGEDKEKSPKFRKAMTPSEVLELVVDGLVGEGSQKLAARNLKPAKFGMHPGFRFEFSFVTASGLDKEGFVVGAIIQDKLYLILYTGARAHYFPKHKEHVERIIESIQMQKKEG